MKKFIKTICIAALLCGVLFCTAVASADTYPTPTDRFFVNDFADVISDADETEIYNLGKNLYAACDAQVVVVTINSLDGTPIEDYAYGLANEWALGDKQKDNGVLLLLAVEDREVRIEVGSGLEGALPDSKTGRILDHYGVDYFVADEFSAGLTSVYTSIYNEVCIEYDVQPQDGYEPVEEDNHWPIEVVIFVVLIVILFSSRRGRARRGFWIWPGGFHGGGFHGEGFGGGSSGGSSGGFGGFSGGGGGFSGGGASRKF